LPATRFDSELAPRRLELICRMFMDVPFRVGLGRL
jgi:hypothetical protein